MKRVRKFLIRLLEPTEDDLSEEDQRVLVAPPDPNKPATLDELRDNHVYHLALGMNALHVRVGRLEAKVGLLLAGVFFLVSAALGPQVSAIAEQIAGRLF
jgi:hypothetical protein